MKNRLIPIICGILFGVGLVLSDMVNPDRVLGFLNVFGIWDPTLAFVMSGALVPMGIAWSIQRLMTKPIAETHFAIPTTKTVDRNLIIGALLFGAGWGLVGFCPGPAIAVLPLDGWQAFSFFGAMLTGMVFHSIYQTNIEAP